jgi:hypothetical protein
MAERQKTGETGIEKNLKQSFAEMDAQRVTQLKNLLVLRQSKLNLHTRDFERRKIKYGEDDARVQETSRKILLGKIFADEIKLEVIRAETPLPPANEKTWLVHGYVFDNERNPVSGATVLFFDEKSNPLHQSERTQTGRNGYFVLETGNTGNFLQKIRVGVSKDDLSEAVFTPRTGAINYAEIFLSGRLEPPVTGISDWIVTGKIVDAKGKGIENLTVNVYEKDLAEGNSTDDFLGKTKTVADGNYTLSFTKKQFSDFGENYPEIYLVVENQKGERIYEGRNEAQTKSGNIELSDIQIRVKSEN